MGCEIDVGLTSTAAAGFATNVLCALFPRATNMQFCPLATN